MFWVASRRVFLIGCQLIFAPEQPHPGRKTRNYFFNETALGERGRSRG